MIPIVNNAARCSVQVVQLKGCIQALLLPLRNGEWAAAWPCSQTPTGVVVNRWSRRQAMIIISVLYTRCNISRTRISTPAVPPRYVCITCSILIRSFTPRFGSCSGWRAWAHIIINYCKKLVSTFSGGMEGHTLFCAFDKKAVFRERMVILTKKLEISTKWSRSVVM